MGAADGSAPEARRAAQQAHAPPPRDRHRQTLGTSGSRCRRFAASLRLALVIDLGDQLRQPRRRLSLVGSQHHLPPCTARAGRLAARDRNPLPRPPGIDPFFSTYAAPAGPLLGRADPPGPVSIGRFTYYPRQRGQLPWGSLCQRDPPGLLVPGAARRCTRLPLVGRCAAGTRSGTPCRASVVSRKSALLHGLGCRRPRVCTA